MKPTTDIEQVKSVARALLMTEVYKTAYSPMVVQHPFTSSGFVATTKDGVMQLIDITESEENLQAWQSFMRKQINSTDNAYEIYMMTNKPYSLTFLKYASPYLSKADFSKILADAWIRSENPNCDTNVSKSKLISMFKQADPHELMLEDELRQYEELDDTERDSFHDERHRCGERKQARTCPVQARCGDGDHDEFNRRKV